MTTDSLTQHTPFYSAEIVTPAQLAADSTVTTSLCIEDQAPSAQRESQQCIVGKIPYTQGIAATENHHLAGYNDGVMAVMVVLFLAAVVNMRHYTTLGKTFMQNLFSVRQRANAFDQAVTTSENRVLITMIAIMCYCEGVLMYCALDQWGATGIGQPLWGIGILSLVAAGYYLFRLGAYSVVGYVFTTPANRSMWLKGFNASETLLGAMLIIPALIALYNPGSWHTMFVVAIAMAILARMIFIVKGFRIFYHNFLGLIYFILYLCALEIIPIILVGKIAQILISQ